MSYQVQSSIGMAATALPPATIQSECELLDKALSDLHEQISRIETAISPICRPLIPAPECAGNRVAPDPASAILERIQRYRTVANMASNRLMELIQRVEL